MVTMGFCIKLLTYLKQKLSMFPPLHFSDLQTDNHEADKSFPLGSWCIFLVNLEGSIFVWEITLESENKANIF